MYLPNIKVVLPDIKSSQHILLSRWMQKHYLVQFLQEHQIKPSVFIEKYAMRIFSNLINMIENDCQESKYLVTKEIINTFKDQDINAYEMFCVYQDFKSACIELIVEGDILSSTLLLNRESVILDIYKLFEHITKELLRFYTEDFHPMQEDLKVQTA